MLIFIIPKLRRSNNLKNMLNIQITKDYKICSDERNFIAMKKQKRKDKNTKDITEDGYRVLGYYPTFEMAATDLTEEMIGSLNVNSLKELSIAIKELKTLLKGLQAPKKT